MSLLAVGSIAFDSIRTPYGQVEEILGGSATFFSITASWFTSVAVVAVVGEDFGEEQLQVFRQRSIDTTGVERVPGRTFRWKGEYTGDMNQAITLETQLNVFERFVPKIPATYLDSKFLFLGNIVPALQLNVRRALPNLRAAALDTMNFWIQGMPEDLAKVLATVEILLINEGEARLLSKQYNLKKAAAIIQGLGPRVVVIKRGEHGATVFGGKSIFTVPAFPLEDVFDPTGAGDTFAGGFMGHLARTDDLSDANVRRAAVYGSVMGSFAVEEFGVGRLLRLTPAEIDARYREIKTMTHLMLDPAVESPVSHCHPWRTPAPVHGAVSILILGVTGASLRYFYLHRLSNLYGDGIAHMEGARRIFDSLTPGYQEIGSVWLPLYHLICAPLAMNDFLWRSGLAGGIVSSAAFALTCYFLFRLGAEINRNVAAGLVALAGALLCPSFLYLASTPLTEPLALLWSVLVAYALFRYSQSGSWRSLAGAAVAALMATLTRYEGWNVLPFATLLVVLIYPYPWKQRVLRGGFFAAIAGAGPLFWLIHNAVRYQNPLEFYNGLGSAKDIYAHQVATTAFLYPTDGSLLLSARYYVEDLKLVIGVWALELAVLGLVAWCASLRESPHAAVALLFIVPLPFYIQAMAHAAIPMYVPTLFPHGYYNLRYGVEMIAAVALFPSFVFLPGLGKHLRLALLIVFMAVLTGQFVQLTAGGARELPVVREGIVNTPCRAQRQRAMIDFLRDHYDGKRILLAAGNWPCVMPELDIPFRNTLTIHNRKYWAKMRSEPGKWVEWIFRSRGDSVDSLMLAYPRAFQDFELIDQGEFPREGRFEIYRKRLAEARSAPGN